MRDDGQMIMLTAVVACVFLALVGFYLYSVRESAAVMQSPGLSRGEVDNVLWAQESCLRWSAAATTGYSWDRRYEAASAYRSAATPALADMEQNLQRRGIAYSFTFDDTAARPYADGKQTECIAGIVVQNEKGSARITGCGYDVRLSDGSASYKAARYLAL